MFILGSCLALNLNYDGCCQSFLSPVCSHEGCSCDKYCHIWNDCCRDIADIGCYPISTSTGKLSKTNH